MNYGRVNKGFTFLLLAAMLGPMAAVRAETPSASHEVRILIREMCRYRIEDSRWQQDPTGLIQEATVAVLSNSTRIWNLKVTAVSQQPMEWSSDRQNWQELPDGTGIVLSGHKVFWERYRLYFRFRGATSDNEKIEYQMYFPD